MPITPDASAAELLDDVLDRAIRAGASDIHVECYNEDVDVRFRIDGSSSRPSPTSTR